MQRFSVVKPVTYALTDATKGRIKRELFWRLRVDFGSEQPTDKQYLQALKDRGVLTWTELGFISGIGRQRQLEICLVAKQLGMDVPGFKEGIMSQPDGAKLSLVEPVPASLVIRGDLSALDLKLSEETQNKLEAIDDAWPNTNSDDLPREIRFLLGVYGAYETKPGFVDEMIALFDATCKDQ